MATSNFDITPLPEQNLPREPSPSEVEDGYYQPIPSRRWYHLILDNLTPMTLRLRTQPQPHPHHPFISHRPRASTSKIPKQEYVITEIPISELGSESVVDKRLRIIAVIKLACILIPVTILCLLRVIRFDQTLTNTD